MNRHGRTATDPGIGAGSKQEKSKIQPVGLASHLQVVGIRLPRKAQNPARILGACDFKRRNRTKVQCSATVRIRGAQSPFYD